MKYPTLSVLVACSALAVAAPAGARVFEGGITHAELQKLLVDSGFNALTVESDKAEPDSVADLVVMGGPGRWYVQFMACKDGRCADLHLHAGFDAETPVPQEMVVELNAAMLGRLAGNVYVDSEQDPILQADVNTDGVSGNNIRFQMRAFDTVMRCLVVKIGFDATAGACDALGDRLIGLTKQGIAADDVQYVIASLGPKDLERVLRENGFSPVAQAVDEGLASFRVEHEGVRWVAAVPAAQAEQINGGVFLLTGCGRCDKDTFRRANAYNTDRRWLSAEGQKDNITATTTIPLSGGITEDSLGMMIRSFHAWAKSFESDLPK